MEERVTKRERKVRGERGRGRQRKKDREREREREMSGGVWGCGAFCEGGAEPDLKSRSSKRSG